VTKPLHVVLMCIIALVAIYGFTAIISPGATEQLVTVLSKVLSEPKWSTTFLAMGSHELGDPISDPVPNHK
jgi:hypothetical protein